MEIWKRQRWTPAAAMDARQRHVATASLSPCANGRILVHPGAYGAHARVHIRRWRPAYGLQIPYAGGKAGDKATRSTSQGGSIWRRWAAGAIAKPRLFSSIARRVATASTIGAQRSATLLCASSRDGAHLKSQKRDRLICVLRLFKITVQGPELPNFQISELLA